jgi:hypothetical protein
MLFPASVHFPLHWASSPHLLTWLSATHLTHTYLNCLLLLGVSNSLCWIYFPQVCFPSAKCFSMATLHHLLYNGWLNRWWDMVSTFGIETKNNSGWNGIEANVSLQASCECAIRQWPRPLLLCHAAIPRVLINMVQIGSQSHQYSSLP